MAAIQWSTKFLIPFWWVIDSELDDLQIKTYNTVKIAQYTTGASQSIIRNSVLIIVESSSKKTWDIVQNRFGNKHIRDGLASSRRQAIIWTNADPVRWRIYVARGGMSYAEF